jgi:tape measure domain-containing protein
MAETIERLAVLIEANTKSYERAMKRLEKKTNTATRKSQKSFNRLDRSMKTTGNAAGALSKRLVGLFGAGLAVRQVSNYADAWTRVSRSIQSTENIFGVRLRSAEALSKLAIESRSDLESLSVLYTRTAAATQELGISEQDVATITTTLAKALKLGSASAAEADSVLRQFSQALQKGKLDGDEFRSVMENAGIVSKALAKELNVTKAELLDLAADGEIRITDLVNAMKKLAPEVNREFANSASTIDESFTNLSTAMTVFIGKLNEATGASDKLAIALDGMTEAIGFVTPAGEFDRLKKELESSEAAVKSLREEYERIKDSGFFSSFVSGQVKGSLDEATAKLNRLRNEIAGISSDSEGRLPDLFKPAKSVGKTPGALPKSRPKNLGPLGFSAPRKSASRNNAQSVIEDLVFEAEQLNRTSSQQAVYNALKAAGSKATSKQKTQISNLVLSLEQQIKSQEDLNLLFEDTNELGRDVFGGIIQGIREGAKASDILANSLSRVGDKLANLALDSVFSGGSKSLFASLFGGGVSGGGLGFAGLFANGGSIPGGQFGLVGERGPEFISGPATITPLNSGRSGGGNVHVTVGTSVDNNGNIRPFVESVAEGKAAIAARKVTASVPSIVDARNQERQVRRIRPQR